MDFAREYTGGTRGIDNRLSAPDTKPDTCDTCGDIAEIKTGTLFHTYYCKTCADKEGITICKRCGLYAVTKEHKGEHICTDCMSAEEYEILMK